MQASQYRIWHRGHNTHCSYPSWFSLLLKQFNTITSENASCFWLNGISLYFNSLKVNESLSHGTNLLLVLGPLGTLVRAAALHGDEENVFDLILAAKQETHEEVRDSATFRPLEQRA